MERILSHINLSSTQNNKNHDEKFSIILDDQQQCSVVVRLFDPFSHVSCGHWMVTLFVVNM